MLMENIPFTVIDWEALEKETHPGKTGTSHWKKFEQGNLRTRIVTYSAHFQSDHWCLRGHTLLVIEGELTIDLKDGRTFTFTKGCGFQVGDDKNNPHLARTESGAKVFIID